MARRSVGEGSVYIRKSDGRPTGQFRWTDEDGRRKTVVVYGTTLKEARAKLNAARERVLAGGPVRDSSATVAEWTKEWMETVLSVRRVEQTTKDTYARIARVHLIRDEFGKRRLADVRKRHLEVYLAEKVRTEDNPEGLSPAYGKLLHTVLLGVFSAAVPDLLAANPMTGVARPEGGSPEAAFLTPEQARAFLAALDGDARLLPLARFLLLTGLRLGEALGLVWEDAVDLEAGTIRVRRVLIRDSKGLRLKDRTKTNRARTVHLDDAAVRVLRARRKAQMADRLRAGAEWRETGVVFSTELGGLLEPNNLRSRFRRAAEKAGMAEVHFHTFRHSAASLMLDEGENPKTVAEHLGHASVRTTLDTYGHVSEAAARRAAGKLGEAFG